MKYESRRLAESGILLALAVILSFLVIFEFPWGGSVTVLSMLPLIILSYRHGVKWGLFCGLVYSVLQMLTGIKTISQFALPGESQMIWYKLIIMCLLDYVIAYTCLGFGGLFRKKKPTVALLLGSLTACSLRYLSHLLSGAIFFGSYAEWFFTEVFPSSTVLNTFSGFPLAFLYSVCYNGCYMLPEIILTSIVAFAVGKFPAIKEKCLDIPTE